MEQDKDSEVIQLGADAYYRNTPMSANPYTHKNLKEKWELGWMLAAEYEQSSPHNKVH